MPDPVGDAEGRVDVVIFEEDEDGCAEGTGRVAVGGLSDGKDVDRTPTVTVSVPV